MAGAVSLLVAITVFLLAQAASPPSVRCANASVLVGVRHDGRPRQKWLSRLGSTNAARKIPHGSLRRRMELAGETVSLESVLGLKQALAIGAAIVVSVAALIVPAALIAGPLAIAAAFRLPDISLARTAKARQALMTDQVPELADVLLVMTEAGLSPDSAFRRIADALPSPLGPELGGVLRRVDMGVPWRSALADVAERTGVAPLRRLVRVLTRSQRLGTSLSAILRTLAEDLRAERRAQAELAARQAPVKMLFPLVFVILPAFLLLTVGPVVLSTIRSLR